MKNDLGKIFDFLHLVKNIKKNLRFKDSPKMPKESIADHSWRLSLMVILFSRQLNLKIKQAKAIKIALVHDIAESITDDVDFALIDQGKVSAKEKMANEVQAMGKIKSMLPPKIAEEIYQLWDEYNQVKTKEAKLVKALDKVEALTTIYEAGYKCYSYPKPITYYATHHIEKFPPLKPVYQQIKNRLKKELRKIGLEWK